VPSIKRNTVVEHRRVDEACMRLAWDATVEILSFDRALARAQELLGLQADRMAA
jgi:hypothetical protein